MPPNEKITREIEGLGGGWELKEDKVVKSFQFSSFMNAIKFVNNVAKIAEEVNHHSIITINWRTVKLSLKSFDVNAITKRDINLAKDIEKAIANSSTANV
jgi:4a-hydroxytetrahydrobiopterin dehydratase